MGCGPIGLGNVLLQAHLGRRIIAVDIADYRIKLATQLGAGQRQSVANSFLAARKGGTVVFNGESSEEMLAPSRDFIRRELWAVGCWYYHFHEIDEMFALWRKGLDVKALVTHRFPLDDAPQAFDLFNRGLTGKVLLRP